MNRISLKNLTRPPDLNAEALLDPSVQMLASAQPFSQDPQAIFLTGASGFLGAFILEQLLCHTEAKVFCLVRAKDEKEAWERIKANLKSYSLWKEIWGDRIIPVLGDLAQPNLGMPQERFLQLGDQIDQIYHNGASVNLIYSYWGLKGPNVIGTQEMLRLAGTGKAKPFQYFSSLTVFPLSGHPENRPFTEKDPPQYCEDLLNGYAQSKWVAENLVFQAKARGFPVAIYRIGEILGHSRRGIFRTEKTDAYSSLLKGILLVGSAPELLVNLYLVPVDFVAAGIFTLARRESSLGRVFHLTGYPMPFSNFFTLVEKAGHPLGRVSFEEWLIQIEGLRKQMPGTPAAALLSMFKSPIFKKMIHKYRYLEIDCKKTLDELAADSLHCPSAEQLLTSQLNHLRDIGFIESPSSTQNLIEN